ncbi:5-hydroxytryptamine receptor 3C [Alosa sapidissima]|uniref:5-hydroxytryptamine receptor 3C n=1 Tax=Alosa sapidissima TaxID=34773 RepID=UPI001C086A4C|nr:5-hydroxytryptamine receptor 3C [Alosa sapidissima]
MEAGMKESPYAQLVPSGIVYTSDSYRMTTSCKMDLHKFPFDTQRCTITLISYIYTIEELRLFSSYNASTVTENSRKMFQSQGEWDLVNVDITRVNLTIGRFVWDQVVYTFIIRRRPLLYVVIFVVPVFYFLVLDLMSFFISGSGGEKLSFKVTVLLAISVLLLILHDMLPSTDQNMPLIGIYCLGIFTSVALSLLETILVSFIMRTTTQRGQRAVTSAVTSDTPADTRISQQGVDVLTVAQVCEADHLSSVCLLRQILQELRLQRGHTPSEDTHLPEARRVCVRV